MANRGCKVLSKILTSPLHLWFLISNVYKADSPISEVLPSITGSQRIFADFTRQSSTTVITLHFQSVWFTQLSLKLSGKQKEITWDLVSDYPGLAF